nr:transposase [Paenibacillus durus]
MIGVDKRSCGYKRRKEALLPAPRVIPEQLDRALSSGTVAEYVLMDSWFTHAPLIQDLLGRGLQVIGIVKNDNKRYLVQDKRLNLKELYAAACLLESPNRHVLRQIRTELAPGIPIAVVFIRNRSKKKEWLAILRPTGPSPLPKSLEPMAFAGTLRSSLNASNPCCACKKSSRAAPTICSLAIRRLSFPAIFC